MNPILAVGIGGALGSIARYGLSTAVNRYFQHAFPWGTLAVNILGCLLLGIVIGLVEHRQLFSPHVRLFLTVGIMGGFTTFSTFGWETFDLLRNHQYAFTLAYVTGNVLVGTLAVIAGWYAVK